MGWVVLRFSGCSTTRRKHKARGFPSAGRRQQSQAMACTRRQALSEAIVVIRLRRQAVQPAWSARLPDCALRRQQGIRRPMGRRTGYFARCKETAPAIRVVHQCGVFGLCAEGIPGLRGILTHLAATDSETGVATLRRHKPHRSAAPDNQGLPGPQLVS